MHEIEEVEIGDGKYQRRCLRGHFETVPTSDTTWYGCGRKATQNALRYFGIAIAQAEIAAYVKGTPMLVNDQIAVYPGHLKVGLQQLLNKFASAKFTVDLHNHMTGADVIPYLRLGLPVVALVNNGSHWVVVSGKDEVGSYVHDNWAFTRRRTLDIGFSCLAGLWASIDGNEY
jgi:Peptidase_C39 like family